MGKASHSRMPPAAAPNSLVLQSAYPPPSRFREETTASHRSSSITPKKGFKNSSCTARGSSRTSNGEMSFSETARRERAHAQPERCAARAMAVPNAALSTASSESPSAAEQDAHLRSGVSSKLRPVPRAGTASSCVTAPTRLSSQETANSRYAGKSPRSRLSSSREAIRTAGTPARSMLESERLARSVKSAIF